MVVQEEGEKAKGRATRGGQVAEDGVLRLEGGSGNVWQVGIAPRGKSCVPSWLQLQPGPLGGDCFGAGGAVEEASRGF